jgi:nucleolar complex protein 3
MGGSELDEDEFDSEFDSELDDDLDDSELEAEVNREYEEEEKKRVRKKAKVVVEEDLEGLYEAQGRKRKEKQAEAGEEDKDHAEVGHLPIKLANGEIEQLPGKTRIAIPSGPPDKRKKKKQEVESDVETEFSESEGSEDEEDLVERIAGNRGKFGRMGVAEILSSGLDGVPWKERSNRRLAMAKEQIAKIGAEIMSGGELLDMVSTPLSATAQCVTNQNTYRSGPAFGQNFDFLAGEGQVWRRI